MFVGFGVGGDVVWLEDYLGRDLGFSEYSVLAMCWKSAQESLQWRLEALL